MDVRLTVAIVLPFGWDDPYQRFVANPPCKDTAVICTGRENMSNFVHSLAFHRFNLGGMETPTVKILHVEQDGTDGVLITFSDETFAGYIVEELLAMRPIREPQPQKSELRKSNI